MSRYWYSYLGGSGTTPQLNPVNYHRITVKPTCIGPTNICAVYAEGGDDTPNPFTEALQQYISDALASSAVDHQPLTGKPFVYKKD